MNSSLIYRREIFILLLIIPCSGAISTYHTSRPAQSDTEKGVTLDYPPLMDQSHQESEYIPNGMDFQMKTRWLLSPRQVGVQ